MPVKLKNLQPDLAAKKLAVTFQMDGGAHVALAGIPFDPSGNQTESELRSLALTTARQALQEILDAPLD